MILQAFIDDSEGPDGNFVLAGHVASAEAWASFAKEWAEMLPHAILSKEGVRHFHMAEMAQGEGMDRVHWFYRIIEEHVLFSVSLHFNRYDIARALKRIWVPNFEMNWDETKNSYRMAFQMMLDGFYYHQRRGMAKVLPEGTQVDFIFDDRTDKSAILGAWDHFKAKRP